MFRSVSIFVLFALVAIAIAKPNRAKFEEFKQKCIEESGVDPELVKGPHHSMEEPVDDKLKCFGACIMKQFGALKEDGTFNLEKAISKIPEDEPDRDKFIAAATACADKTGDNECETSYEIFKCLHEQKIPHMHPHGPHKHD